LTSVRINPSEDYILPTEYVVHGDDGPFFLCFSGIFISSEGEPGVLGVFNAIDMEAKEALRQAAIKKKFAAGSGWSLKSEETASAADGVGNDRSVKSLAAAKAKSKSGRNKRGASFAGRQMRKSISRDGQQASNGAGGLRRSSSAFPGDGASAVVGVGGGGGAVPVDIRNLYKPLGKILTREEQLAASSSKAGAKDIASDFLGNGGTGNGSGNARGGGGGAAVVVPPVLPPVLSADVGDYVRRGRLEEIYNEGKRRGRRNMIGKKKGEIMMMMIS
jgi:hypothetical protein